MKRKQKGYSIEGEMREVSYEEILVYVRTRIWKDYETVANFAKQFQYPTRNGIAPEGTITSYLSFPRQGVQKKGGKNLKFLAYVAEKLWGVKITQQQIVEKKTVLRANL